MTRLSTNCVSSTTKSKDTAPPDPAGLTNLM
jgi:hypothetical protein